MQDCSAGHNVGHGGRLHSWFYGFSRLSRGSYEGRWEQVGRRLVKLVLHDHQRQIRLSGIVLHAGHIVP